MKLRADGLVVPGEPFFDSQRNRIVALAAQHSVATTYVWREYVAAGGLVSYGPSLTDCIAKRVSTLAEFSTAPKRATCRSYSQRNSSWLSTSGPPKRSDSKCRRIFSSAPTR